MPKPKIGIRRQAGKPNAHKIVLERAERARKHVKALGAIVHRTEAANERHTMLWEIWACLVAVTQKQSNAWRENLVEPEICTQLRSIANTLYDASMQTVD